MACWQNLMVKEVYPWENVHTCQEKLGYSENEFDDIQSYSNTTSNLLLLNQLSIISQLYQCSAFSVKQSQRA